MSALSQSQWNPQGQPGGFPSDSGIPSANQRITRVLPIMAGEGGGMQTTREAKISEMWMNPIDAPRPSVGQGTVQR